MGLDDKSMLEYKSNVDDWNALNDEQTNWLHSDIKNKAYFYLYPIFSKFLE